MWPLLDLQGLGLGADQRLDLRIDHALAVVVVLVIAGARLLPVPAHLDDLVGDAGKLRRLARELALLADAVADVEAGEVAHRQRAHGHAPGLQRAVDLLRHGALQRHGLHLPAIGRQHAVADEAVAHAGLHADLADLLAIAIEVAITSLAVFSARTISSSRMMLAGEKKCSPTTSCGRLVAAAISSTSSVEVLVAMMAPDLAILSSFCEHLLLQRHVLEHRLDDEVGLAEVLQLQRRGELGEAVGGLRLGDAPALGVGRQRVLDAVDAAVERLLRGLDDGHGEAAVEERQRRCRCPWCRRRGCRPS